MERIRGHAAARGVPKSPEEGVDMENPRFLLVKVGEGYDEARAGEEHSIGKTREGTQWRLEEARG